MIEVNNLSFSYNSKDHALTDVSFKVKDKEWLSIIGHNGSGKSTIAKLLVGLLEPTKGSILYDGIELTEKTVDKIRHRVGIVFQNPDNQFVGFNVKYDIAFGLENHQIEREEMNKLIDEYTKKVDMFEYKLREPQNLSGGQKQRVAIAGILAMNCDIIILDEPINALDEDGAKKIHQILEEQKKRGAVIIIACHDKEELEMLSDEIIEISEGRVVS